ncbi:hypothetical protein C3Z14_04375 [Proteus mirabilis]|nr:hypothetical protein C3Z14_04375 [Proteus mirabilis]AZH06136.1 transposase [Proteus mirabilis]EKT9691598.1 transposase [Proteus mirabilis]EKU2833075.1 transposase [Proteus mirabilis]EKU4146327.1 transposase [Proteus mirabilis]
MKKRTNRFYTTEFKQEAVALVIEQGYSVSKAAAALGITNKFHCCFNIINFFKLISRILCSFYFTFNIISKCSMVSLYSCRAKTLQHVKNIFQLSK